MQRIFLFRYLGLPISGSLSSQMRAAMALCPVCTLCIWEAMNVSQGSVLCFIQFLPAFYLKTGQVGHQKEFLGGPSDKKPVCPRKEGDRQVVTYWKTLFCLDCSTSFLDPGPMEREEGRCCLRYKLVTSR